MSGAGREGGAAVCTMHTGEHRVPREGGRAPDAP